MTFTILKNQAQDLKNAGCCYCFAMISIAPWSIHTLCAFRRFYVLDADVEEQSFDLFVIDPKADNRAEPPPFRSGGHR